MEESCDFSQEFDCPSLLCEELQDEGTKNSQRCNKRLGKLGEVQQQILQQRDEEEEAQQVAREQEQEVRGKKAESSVVAAETEEEEVRLDTSQGGEDEQVDGRTEANQVRETHEEDKDTKSSDKRDERKRNRKRKGRKPSERGRNRKQFKRVSERQEQSSRSQTQEVSAVSSEDGSALSEPPAAPMNSCDLSDPAYLGLYCPPLPTLYSAQPPAPMQPAPPQAQGSRRPPSTLLAHSLPPPGPQPLEMEITQVYSTRRSIRYRSRGRGQALNLSLLPGLEAMDSCLQPPALKKKTRTLYSTDQLEHLEALFQEDHYPDAEKRKVIAASVGVTPQRIMVWFQNRRAKWRKAERSLTAELKQAGGGGGSPQQPLGLPLSTLSQGVPSFAAHYGNKLPPMASTGPPFASLSSQTFPSYSHVPPSVTCPAPVKGRDGGPQPLSAQGALTEYQPRPMHSPPPLRRASLPLFQTGYNPANPPPPPLHNTLAHTPPLFPDASEGGSALAQRDALQPLQTDTSSLFDFVEKFEYLTSSQQNSSLQYQFQAAYPSGQPQPRMAYLTPSPYLTPNAPDSNPASYLTFGPGGSSAGLMTYSAGGHAYFQSQNTGQILLQSAGHHGGMAAYQSYPWGSLYSQPAMQQRAPCPPAMGGAREHQPLTSTLPPLSFFTVGDHAPSHASSQGSSHSQPGTGTGTTSTTTTTSSLPPVSTLRAPPLRAEVTPTKAAPLLPSQSSPAAPHSPPAPPCAKMEYDSPQEIHSHFHCDFSPIHF